MARDNGEYILAHARRYVASSRRLPPYFTPAAPVASIQEKPKITP